MSDELDLGEDPMFLDTRQSNELTDTEDEDSREHLGRSSDDDEITGPLEGLEEERDSVPSLPGSMRNTPAGPMQIVGSLSGRGSSRLAQPSGRGEQQHQDAGYHVMGTSLPIRIPQASFKGAQSLMTGMARLQKQQHPAPPAPPPGPDGFVPPHLLDPYYTGTEEAFNVLSVIEGTTPGARMKKDLLRQRNRIMKATGFLESDGIGSQVQIQGQPGAHPIPIRAAAAAEPPRTPGGLSGLLSKGLAGSVGRGTGGPPSRDSVDG